MLAADNAGHKKRLQQILNTKHFTANFYILHLLMRAALKG